MSETTKADALRRVLVPLDGSAMAEGVLDPAERLLGPGPAEVYLVRVLEEGQAQPARDPSIEDARAYLDRVAQRFHARNWEFERHVRNGEAANEILSMSEEIGPDLIAMSTHGRSGVERWVRGSVAERVLRHSSVPLLLVNPFGLAQWETGFQRILVPLDGSERSETILPLAESVARRLDSQLILFHAVEPDAMLDADARFARVEEQVERLQASGCNARIERATGWAAEEILEVAEHDSALLVAMTTHGWTGFDRWAFGSVAEKVLRHCRCPLLFVRS